MKMFQAISLESGVDEAKLLAFAAPGLIAGVARVDKRELELTAIIEPIVWPEGDNEPDKDQGERYDYARETMKQHEIRVMTTAHLADLAETARIELKV
jgi:hypothetical protein